MTLKSQPEFSEWTEMALTPHATRSNKPALIHFVSVSLLQANLSKVPLKTPYFCAFHYFCDQLSSDIVRTSAGYYNYKVKNASEF